MRPIEDSVLLGGEMTISQRVLSALCGVCLMGFFSLGAQAQNAPQEDFQKRLNTRSIPVQTFLEKNCTDPFEVKLGSGDVSDEIVGYVSDMYGKNSYESCYARGRALKTFAMRTVAIEHCSAPMTVQTENVCARSLSTKIFGCLHYADRLWSNDKAGRPEWERMQSWCNSAQRDAAAASRDIQPDQSWIEAYRILARTYKSREKLSEIGIDIRQYAQFVSDNLRRGEWRHPKLGKTPMLDYIFYDEESEFHGLKLRFITVFFDTMNHRDPPWIKIGLKPKSFLSWKPDNTPVCLIYSSDPETCEGVGATAGTVVASRQKQEEMARQERILAQGREWARLSPARKEQVCHDQCGTVLAACAAGNVLPGAIVDDAFGGGLGGMLMAEALTEDCDAKLKTCVKHCAASDQPPG